MMRKLWRQFPALFPAILLAAMAMGAPAYASQAEAICVDDSREAFRRAIHGHIKAYQSLIATRGIAAAAGDVADIDIDNVLSFIDADLEHLSKSSSGRPVVAFYAQDADQTCGFLLSAGQPLLYARQRLAPAALSELIDNWRRSLAIEQLVASRAPRKRAAESAMDDAVATGPTEAETRALLSSALMPAAFADAIPLDAELIIVPTNDIGTLPFALLDLGSGERLVERAAVTIAANLWEALLIEREEFVGIADSGGSRLSDEGWTEILTARQVGVAPGWPKAVLVGDPDATRDPEWDFPRLPGARSEVEEIGGFLAGDPLSGPAAETLTGEGATREAVLQAMGGGPSLIYFAAHGVADVEEPLDGFLALTDGRLTARDVQSTMTGAGLVVLSACQTGLGRAHAGGVIGLARGFQLAGATAVAMSLWNVDDEATRLLMTHFMRRVGHASPSQALRESMLSLRETHPDPLLWGSFQVFGSLMPAAR